MESSYGGGEWEAGFKTICRGDRRQLEKNGRTEVRVVQSNQQHGGEGRRVFHLNGGGIWSKKKGASSGCPIEHPADIGKKIRKAPLSGTRPLSDGWAVTIEQSSRYASSSDGGTFKKKKLEKGAVCIMPQTVRANMHYWTKLMFRTSRTAQANRRSKEKECF